MDKKVRLTVAAGKLLAQQNGVNFEFDFPAVTVAIKGKRIAAKTAVSALEKNRQGAWSQNFCDGGLNFLVTITPEVGYFRKSVKITSAQQLPTPDYVEVDAQQVADPELKLCGYMATAFTKKSKRAQEEAGGSPFGCGYPLIGRHFFAGLEHPAAFNSIVKQDDKKASYTLRHFPIWRDGQLESVSAVIGLSRDARQDFADYLDTIRLAPLTKPLYSFCSFWSDPYLGNYEYGVQPGNYRSLVREFSAKGIRPDIYTLDAGWHNRKSFFEAKEAFGGDRALKKLAQEFRDNGSNLSLWISHNGPMGMDWDFLKSQGIAVGSGMSASYCGEHYAVMMDPKLEAALTKRFCELAGPKYGTVHFKIDWDNDCATSPEFAEIYPTRDHVREGSINMMTRVAAAIRQVNPQVIIRNGWWPSPWWLSRINHVFLANSGDCEVSSYPALTQRDSIMTHRDTMYYCMLQRDRTPLPLDCFDNHEFSHARRNPLVEEPVSWMNTCLWSVMRGASYFPYTLQPEALEEFQFDALRETMAFARQYAPHIFVRQGRMVGGHPDHGEIYGFYYPGSDGEAWCALRNPAPYPQEYEFTDETPGKEILQFYPDFRRLKRGEKIIFTAHEVKVMIFSARPHALPCNAPFQVALGKQGYEYFRPSPERPQVPEIYQLPVLEFISPRYCRETKNGLQLEFSVRVPYRTRNFRLQFKIKNSRLADLNFKLSNSRYAGWNFCCYGVPITELPFSCNGNGENLNPDCPAQHDFRCFSADLPQGGEAFMNFEITGAPVKFSDLEMWVSGFIPPARRPELQGNAPEGFEQLLPPQHPLGFPVALKLTGPFEQEPEK